MNRTRSHWRKATKGYLVDQLSKHGWKWSKTPVEKKVKLLKPELAQIMIDLLGIYLLNQLTNYILFFILYKLLKYHPGLVKSIHKLCQHGTSRAINR